VHERDRRNNESTDVMVKLVNGESHGMFILEVEPKELTIVMILGPIRMDDLSKLRGLAGLSVLNDVARENRESDREKEKDKEKEKKGGTQ
jgi:hypothetical protein